MIFIRSSNSFSSPLPLPLSRDPMSPSTLVLISPLYLGPYDLTEGSSIVSNLLTPDISRAVPLLLTTTHPNPSHVTILVSGPTLYLEPQSYQREETGVF